MFMSTYFHITEKLVKIINRARQVDEQSIQDLRIAKEEHYMLVLFWDMSFVQRLLR